MADNTRAKKKRKANDGSPPTSTPELARTGQRPERHQENHQVSLLDVSERDTNDESCSSGDEMLDNIEEDEESPQFESAFFSKNIFNALEVQTTPPSAVADAAAAAAVSNADDAVISDSNRSDAAASLPPLLDMPMLDTPIGKVPCISCPNKNIDKCLIHGYTYK